MHDFSCRLCRTKEEGEAALAPLERAPSISKCLSKAVNQETNFEKQFDAAGATWPENHRNLCENQESNADPVEVLMALRAKINPEVITAEDVIEMATLAGYRATGWQNDIGSLEAGRKADLILINTDRPEWVPTYNYVYSLVYTASGDSVDTTIVDGHILMENRELTTIDLAEVHAKCRELAPKLAARANVRPQSRWPVL